MGKHAMFFVSDGTGLTAAALGRSLLTQFEALEAEIFTLPLLRPRRDKLFGLSIAPARLREIRQARRPDSRYASLAQRQMEAQRAEALFRATRIPSVEEIATLILQTRRLKQVY